MQVERKLSLAHRSRVDIIANILRVALDDARKTHIMYRCNLSFKQLHIYLNFLTERKLIKRSRIGKDKGNLGTYQTTNRGKAFLQAYGNIRALLSTAELEADE